MTRCKYCNKDLGDAPCSTAREANACNNAHPDVIYADRRQHQQQYRKLIGNLRRHPDWRSGKVIE